jgi:putative copper export protein
MRGLFGTDYRRLVQVKITLFIAMFWLAAVNRLRLLLRLLQVEGPAGVQQTEQTLRQLRRNTLHCFWASRRGWCTLDLQGGPV